MLTSRASYAIAVFLLLLSALLRMSDLAAVPQGYSEDEIINIRLVDNVRQGDIYVFFPGEDGGREGAYHVLVAMVTAFVGEGTIGYRILSVWLSLLSVAIVYTLGHHLFNPTVGVMAAGLLAVNFSSILLARTVSSDALVIFLVAAAMLALARALPVYRRTRSITSNIISFTALGVLLGISFYIHPSSLFIVLGSMAYITYLLFIRNAMLRERRSYTGFAILVMLIIAMPYLISSINLPQYAAAQRILSQYTDGLLRSIVDGLVAILIHGDADPLHNLPGRSLVDAFSGLLMLGGIVACLQRWRKPRFMLTVIMLFLALPAALIVENSPNFSQFGVILPQLAIFFGIGCYALIVLPIFDDLVFRRMAIAGALGLLAFNGLWTWQDLFVGWRSSEAVIPLVNGKLGQTARFLDRYGNALPTVICNANWDSTAAELSLNDSDKTLLMMNRTDFEFREADCSGSLILTDGGAAQRIVLFPDSSAAIHPYLQEWLMMGEFVAGDVPRDSILKLETSQILADRAGELITTAPVAYAPEAVGSPVPLSPPIRFGGNLTFLGYEPNVKRQYLPGETVDVIAYWRVEGRLPSDITLFTHILSDPVTLIANHDVIKVNPTRLRERDVFIQVTQVRLPEAALPGEYFIGVGSYTQSDGERLPTLQDGEPLGDRIFLYSIEVLPPETSEG